MLAYPSEFEHHFETLDAVAQQLHILGADRAVLKLLPKNANDKNQVYFASDFGSLYNNFDLTLSERGESSSMTKYRSTPGSDIPEAVFNKFSWLRRDGTLVRAKNVKVIVYTQYPEARLSGFVTVQNTMPQSLSVGFTKASPEVSRLLVLGRLPRGECVAMMVIGIGPSLMAEIADLPGLEGSRVCKLLMLRRAPHEQLFQRLAKHVSRLMKGCRLDVSGKTLPFTGTQVCGYTLEHALEIIPNSGKNGDVDGIELKTHTQVKVTLFTPEPDFGLYANSFEKFMRTYGYVAENNEIRLTGVHRANQRCSKSGLTLKVIEYRTVKVGEKMDWVRDEQGRKKAFKYDPTTSLTSKMNGVEVVLEDDDGLIAAGWSLERLMNNWGVKHNEVVYISAARTDNENVVEVAQGFAYNVTFAPDVIWCRETSAERLLLAIANGTIFLDPAPKFVPGDPAKNKRRAQWRVNDITKAVHVLYEKIEPLTLVPTE